MNPWSNTCGHYKIWGILKHVLPYLWKPSLKSLVLFYYLLEDNMKQNIWYPINVNWGCAELNMSTKIYYIHCCYLFCSCSRERCFGNKAEIHISKNIKYWKITSRYPRGIHLRRKTIQKGIVLEKIITKQRYSLQKQPVFSLPLGWNLATDTFCVVCISVAPQWSI